MIALEPVGKVASAGSWAVPVLESWTVPSAVEPFMNVTVPVIGLAPLKAGVTVAVKMTFCPKTVGLTEAATALVVVVVVTVSVTVPEVLVVKLPFPA